MIRKVNIPKRAMALEAENALRTLPTFTLILKGSEHRTIKQIENAQMTGVFGAADRFAAFVEKMALDGLHTSLTSNPSPSLGTTMRLLHSMTSLLSMIHLTGIPLRKSAAMNRKSAIQRDGPGRRSDVNFDARPIHSMLG